MDLQIKLLSPCPLKGPTVTSSLCEGETATIGQPNLASPPGTLLRRKGEGEKEAFPRTCSPLCLSQCRIYPHQHTCQPDSYEPFSSARHERGTVSKLRCVSSIVWTCVCTNLCSSGLTMDAHEYEKRCVEKKHGGSAQRDSTDPLLLEHIAPSGAESSASFERKQVKNR